MKIGLFHPSLNKFGGGEFVAFVITNTLAKNGYEIELLVSERIRQTQIKKMFGEEMDPSVKITVKPFHTQPGSSFDICPTLLHSLVFKSKCDILIDTYSNCIFPWADICYIHFPFLNDYNYRTRFPYLRGGRIRPVLGFPHMLYARKLQNYENKLIIANSNYSAEGIRKFLNVRVEIMYPPVPQALFEQSFDRLISNQKENLVVTVSRFSFEKELEKIPKIAKLAKGDLKFILIGLLHDPKVYEYILRSIKELDLEKKVEVIANAPKKELENILKRAKVYLHTMTGEHFGISIVEAMAMGCIPIVHNSGGMSEFVPARYRYENLEDATRKIETAIREWTPEKARTVINIANQFSESNFSKNFIRLFSSYVERKRKNAP